MGGRDLQESEHSLADVVAGLEAVVAELRDVKALLGTLPKAMASATHVGASLTREDRATLAVLLPAIASAIGAATFTVSELIKASELDEELGRDLQRVLGDSASLASRKLGKLLRRADGFTQDGFAVKAGHRARDGILWSVVRVS